MVATTVVREAGADGGFGFGFGTRQPRGITGAFNLYRRAYILQREPHGQSPLHFDARTGDANVYCGVLEDTGEICRPVPIFTHKQRPLKTLVRDILLCGFCVVHFLFLFSLFFRSRSALSKRKFRSACSRSPSCDYFCALHPPVTHSALQRCSRAIATTTGIRSAIAKTCIGHWAVSLPTHTPINALGFFPRCELGCCGVEPTGQVSSLYFAVARDLRPTPMIRLRGC